MSQFRECPIIMADGRFGTYYGSTNDYMNRLQRRAGFRNSNEFRRFLQEYGGELKRRERENFIRRNFPLPLNVTSQGYQQLLYDFNGDWSGVNNFNRSIF